MGDFVSYSNYQPTNEAASAPMRSEPRSGQTTVIFRNGEATTETSGLQHASTADLADYGDWRGTARNAKGLPTRDVTDDSVVTINGMSAKIKEFISAGVISKDWAKADARDGGEAGSARVNHGAILDHTQNDRQDAPQVDTEAVTHPAEVAEVLQASVADIPQHAYDNAMASGMHLAATGGDMASIAEGLSRNTGMDPSKAAQVVDVHTKVYQAQADVYLTHRAGLAAEDLPAFYEFCRDRSQKGALAAAIQGQVHSGSMVGYKALVDKFLSNSAPSEAALNARGFETKDGTHGPMVRIQGQWMSVKVAAKTGLI